MGVMLTGWGLDIKTSEELNGMSATALTDYIFEVEKTAQNINNKKVELTTNIANLEKDIAKQEEELKASFGTCDVEALNKLKSDNLVQIDQIIEKLKTFI